WIDAAGVLALTAEPGPDGGAADAAGTDNPCTAAIATPTSTVASTLFLIAGMGPGITGRPYRFLTPIPSAILELFVLGGAEAYHGGVRVELGRRHERRLLALLLLEPRRIVATDRLLDLMWDGDPPPTARATLHTYVSRLRKRLAPYAIELHHRAAGY